MGRTEGEIATHTSDNDVKNGAWNLEEKARPRFVLGDGSNHDKEEIVAKATLRTDTRPRR